MGCGDEKLSKYLTQTFTAHCNAMICQQVTLLGDAEWPKVADAVIEAPCPTIHPPSGRKPHPMPRRMRKNSALARHTTNQTAAHRRGTPTVSIRSQSER